MKQCKMFKLIDLGLPPPHGTKRSTQSINLKILVWKTFLKVVPLDAMVPFGNITSIASVETIRLALLNFFRIKISNHLPLFDKVNQFFFTDTLWITDHT